MSDRSTRGQLEFPNQASSVRHLVLVGMTSSVVVAYLTRTVLAPASSVIQRELSLTNLEMGAVHGVWAFGYVGFQLPGGWLGDRFGRRVILPLYGVLWSVCTLWTAQASTFAELWWSRLIFGAAQAGLVPCLTRACFDWFPEDSRGWASAAITAGMSAGAVIASGLAAFLIPVLGWRLSCQLFALSGILWAIEFWRIFRDRPEIHPRVNRAELELIRKPTVLSLPSDPSAQLSPSVTIERPTSGGVPSPWGALQIYGLLALFLLAFQAMCRTFCYNFLTTWFPTFLERGLGANLRNAGLMTMLPLAGYVGGAMIGGVLIDRLLRATRSKWKSRSGVAATALLVAAAGSVAAIFTPALEVALLVLAIGAAASGLASPATWAAAMDLGGRSSATVMGIVNMTGNLGAFLCPLAVGAILDATGDRWNLVLLMFAGVSLAGALSWVFLDPQRPLRLGDRV